MNPISCIKCITIRSKKREIDSNMPILINNIDVQLNKYFIGASSLFNKENSIRKSVSLSRY